MKVELKCEDGQRNSGSMLKYSNKKQLNLGITVICMILITAIIELTVFYIQPNSLKSVLNLAIEQPFILVLNYIAPLLILIILYFVTNNLFYSGAITSCIFNVCSLINRLKIELRDEPFSPKDIELIQEAANTVSDFNVQIKYNLVAIIIITVMMLLGIGFFVESFKFNKSIRIIGCLASILATLVINKGLYGSQEIYLNKLKVSNRNSISKVYNELGFTYCFLYNLNSEPIERPEGFSVEETKNLISTYISNKDTLPEERPHVIFVMSEAFSDIGMKAPFNYTKENSPYKYWQEVIDSPHTIAGHIITPNFGGGTSNTEFDVMTGMQTNMLSSIPTYAFSVLKQETNSIARMFAKNNYQTLFMHPGESWFYNRQEAYNYLGVETSIFSESFKEEDKKGNMIADSVLTEHIIHEFERRTKDVSDQPLFAYVTTIQNHMPYTGGKYGDLLIQEVQTSKELSQDAKDYLSVYMEGIRDASQMLKDLTTYFEKQNEPVVLVFFGDHLPNLGDNYLAYRELGLDIGKDNNIENIIDTYSTPYVIWANEEAAQVINLKAAEETLQLPEGKKISANYLGVMVLELLGYKTQDPFFDYINELRKYIPIIYKDNYKVSKNEEKYTTSLNQHEQTLVNNLRKWEYYKMHYDEKID